MSDIATKRNLILSAISLAVAALATVQVLGFSDGDESITFASLTEFGESSRCLAFVDFGGRRDCGIARARCRYA